MFYFLSRVAVGLFSFLFSLILSTRSSLSRACRFRYINLRASLSAILGFLPLALSVARADMAWSAQVAPQWNANTNLTVSGYTFYGDASSDSDIDAGNATTNMVSKLANGVAYYFATADYNSFDTESEFSNQILFSATACTYSLYPSSQSFSSSGGTGSVSVNTSAGCTWTAGSNATWISISYNTSVTGSGTVNYSVASNTSSSSRTGTISIAGVTFTISQSGQ